MEKDLKALGYQIVAISPDKAGAKTKVSADSPARLLSDSKMAAARAFGISYRVDQGMFDKLKGYGIDLIGASGENHRQLPVPAIFVAGTDGRISFTYVNPDYSMRLKPEVLLAVAKSGGAYNPRKAGK